MIVISATIGEHHAAIRCDLGGWWVEYTEKETSCFSCKHEKVDSYDEAVDFLINWERERLGEVRANLSLEAKA